MSSVLTRQEPAATTRLQDAATHYREVSADPYARATPLDEARKALQHAGDAEVQDLVKRLAEAGLQLHVEAPRFGPLRFFTQVR